MEAVGHRGLLPNGEKAFVVHGANLVDAAEGAIGLHTAWVVVRDEEPLEMTADAEAILKGMFCQMGFLLQ